MKSALSLHGIRNGQLYQIEALVLNVPYGRHPGWGK